MTTKRPKTKTEKTTAGTCPECARALITSKADPRGRPMCEGVLSGACHYIGAATKPPAAREWGRREDAHLAAVEKWLADEHRTDAEIEAMLDAGNYERAARTFGQSALAWQRGRAILAAELAARGEMDKGRNVERKGAHLAKGPTKERGAGGGEALDCLMRLAGLEGTPNAEDKLLKAFVRQRDGMPPGASKVDVCRALARTEMETAYKSPDACPWLQKTKAHAIHKAYVSGKGVSDKDVETHAATLKKRLQRALKNAKA